MKPVAQWIAATLLVQQGVLGTEQGRFGTTVAISDPKLQDGLRSLNLQVDYTRTVSEGVDVGVAYSPNQDKLLPSELFMHTTQRVVGLNRAPMILRAQARYNRVIPHLQLAGKLTLMWGTISTAFSSRTGWAPLEMFGNFVVDGRQIGVTLRHDLAHEEGTLRITGKITRDIAATLDLGGDGQAAIVVSQKRAAGKQTSVVPSVSVLPFIREGPYALGKGHVGAAVSTRLADSATLTLDARDNLDVLWQLSDARSQKRLTLSGKASLRDPARSTLGLRYRLEVGS